MVQKTSPAAAELSPFVPPPYPYERLDGLLAIAAGLPGGAVDLSIGTPIINVLGSFLMSLLGGWFLLRSGSSPGWRLFLTTGGLDGVTTFSTFSLEAALH